MARRIRGIRTHTSNPDRSCPDSRFPTRDNQPGNRGARYHAFAGNSSLPAPSSRSVQAQTDAPAAAVLRAAGWCVNPPPASSQYARVSVPAAMEMDDDFDSAFEHGKAVGWNAYRAAMLHGAEPVTTDYKLPFDQWLSQQTGTIDVECGCVMTEVFFHWLRVAYEAGDSPVIPDGWVMVPVEPTMSQEFAGYRTLTDTGKMSRLMKTRLSNIYRAMIAAAPQQEVKP